MHSTPNRIQAPLIHPSFEPSHLSVQADADWRDVSLRPIRVRTVNFTAVVIIAPASVLASVIFTAIVVFVIWDASASVPLALPQRHTVLVQVHGIEDRNRGMSKWEGAASNLQACEEILPHAEERLDIVDRLL